MTDKLKFHKPKKFLKTPHIRGNREQLKEFLKKNLTYPKAAIENKIEGDVIIRYKVSDNGEVYEPAIVKGLGYGCDEEAIRLVKMIQYDAVKNRGVRVTAHSKIKIPFRLPRKKTQQKIKMVYTQSPGKEKSGKKKPAEEKNPPKTTYNYTIKF
ncbi:MAG: energy transducer TonB [Bacteroidales bacterium]|nr:energy transducer TonB [Bacteroidales bacterium]